MDRYIAALYAIVTKGLNTNSYKFALWRALASLASGTDKKRPTISKQQLAPLFLSYYWPLEVKYHITRTRSRPSGNPARRRYRGCLRGAQGPWRGTLCL